MKKLKILVGCEESQAVTIAFRELGHEAYSCDLLPCSGGYPEWHFQMDVFRVINGPGHRSGYVGNLLTQARTGVFIKKWDLIICFPPCTDLTVSGARWFEAKRLSGSQRSSIKFFFELWKVSNALENPIGIMNGGSYIEKWFPGLYLEMKAFGFQFKPTQIIQPWQFGHGETKATCLWLNGLPKLQATDIVSGREQRIWKMAPSEDRAKLRSKTFPGIAAAIANQWGNPTIVKEIKPSQQELFK